MQIDGFFYQNEGNYMVLDTNNISSYALTSLPEHSHSYLPLSGGIISGGNIAFNSNGLPQLNGNFVPAGQMGIASNGILLSGKDTYNDGAAIFLENGGTESNKLIIALGDDANNADIMTKDYIAFRYYGTDGVIHAESKIPKNTGTIALTSDIPNKVSQLTNDANYTTATGHTHSYVQNATYLYASDSPYRYGDSAPYYLKMRYNINNDNRWYLSVYPETPKEVSVDYAVKAGTATNSNGLAGYIWEGKQNSIDTWVPVFTTINGQNKLQYRTIPAAYNGAPSTLSVGSAVITNYIKNLNNVNGTTKPYDYNSDSLSIHSIYGGTSTGFTFGYGNVLTIRGTGTTQLALEWNAAQTDTNPNVSQRIAIRSQRDSAGNNWSKWTEVLTDGNYTSYCASVGHTHSYLPLSGGTMSGSTQVNSSVFPAFVLNHTGSASESGIRFEMKGANKGYVGYHNSYGTYIWNSTAAKYLCIADDGKGYLRSTSTAYELIHSGNISSYALTSLPDHSHNNLYYTEAESDGRFYPLTGSVNMSGDNKWIGSTMGGGTDYWRIGGYGSGDNGICKITIGDNSNDKFQIEIADYSGTTYTPLEVTNNGINISGQITASNVIKANSGIRIGSTDDIGWYLNSSRITAGTSVARDVNVGSLLVSNAWADASKVPTNGIYSKGQIKSPAGFFQDSDERLKDFQDDIQVDLYKIKSLPKKYFTWKDGDNKNNQIGTSAQAVQEIYPELVSTNSDGTLSVAYDKLSIIALAAIDELHNELLNIREENRLLKEEIKQIKLWQS
jgi:hypothetical protein